MCLMCVCTDVLRKSKDAFPDMEFYDALAQLSDVMEGGGTAFSQAGVHVT